MLTTEPGVELRQLGGRVVPAVSSPGRQSLQSQYQSATPTAGPLYSQASRGLPPPSTTYNPGYQDQTPGRRYLSQGELLAEPGQVMGGSSSAGHIQDQLYYQGGAGGHNAHAPSDPQTSPVHSHSYAQQVSRDVVRVEGDSPSSLQVGYFLQQPVPVPTLQSGGPRTTPSGYPGGPVVPSGQLSPKLGRRPQGHSSPYSDNVIRTTSGPISFTRALEVTDSLAGGLRGTNGGRTGQEGDHRESVYDMNYEISV